MFFKVKTSKGFTILEMLITMALMVIVFTGIGAGIVAGGQHIATSRRMMNAEALADQLQMQIMADLRVAQPAKQKNEYNSNIDKFVLPMGSKYKYEYPIYVNQSPILKKDYIESNLIMVPNSPSENTLVNGVVGEDIPGHKVKYRPSVLANARYQGNNGAKVNEFVTLTDGSSRYENIFLQDTSMGSRVTKYELKKREIPPTSENIRQQVRRGIFHFKVGFEIFDEQGVILQREFVVYPVSGYYELPIASIS